MKLKHVLILFLAAGLCFGLVACNSDAGEDLETYRKDLAAMDDTQLIPVLLDNYASYAEPAVFAAEMSWIYRSGETVVAAMEGTVRSTGADRAGTVAYTVGETVKEENYIYSNGIFYSDSGAKTKTAAEAGEVSSFLAARYPDFGTVSDYNFQKSELLRSEDGTYSLVLFLPANGIADSADITTPLTAAGNETAPVALSDFSDIYLTLLFSAEGNLTGQTLGFDCKMTADGVETEGTVLLKFRLVSTEPIQSPISAPGDADSYKEAQTDPFASADPQADGGSGDSSDGE